jgi:hypothetical protein
VEFLASSGDRTLTVGQRQTKNSNTGKAWSCFSALKVTAVIRLIQFLHLR